METIVIMLAVIMVIAVYFTPTAIAFFRKKNNLLAIGVLNLFAGWTFIGWMVALVWAFKKDSN